MFLRYLFYAFLIFLAYRLVFHLIIPIYKTTKQVKKQFREMNSRMEDHMNQQSSSKSSDEIHSADTNAFNKKQQAGDYIDFEDVK